MEDWLRAALDYIPRWMDFQMRQSGVPGCMLSVARHGTVVLEQAWGVADLGSGEALTPRHRFRVASHSKTFTAAGVMLLRERGRLSLDDAIGRHVPGLHPEVAAATLTQLLSHSAGLTRDGMVTGQFADRRPFASREELVADLADGTTIPPVTRFKYSNHGFALAGMAIEAVTGEPYAAWMTREVVERFGLAETRPDMPLPPGTSFARGHTGPLPAGRFVIPGENPGNAVAPAAAFVSTASDLVRFFTQLAPESEQSPLSVASRREMTRWQWRNPHTNAEMHYGLGTIGGVVPGEVPWTWFGHSGRLQGYVSRTAVVGAEGLAVSVLINALDGVPEFWLDGCLRILRLFRTRGTAGAATRDWQGRWWTIWGAVDLLPLPDRVLVATPAFWNPLLDASEIEVTGADTGRVALAPGFGSQGEPVRLVRDAAGQVTALDFAGMRMVDEAALALELRERYATR
jgi:CubicO group peptidase (beta-lactamase class C family)